eukprot:2569300-Amphidinium_carterae.1
MTEDQVRMFLKAKNPMVLIEDDAEDEGSRAEGLLSMGHDLILMHETFLLQPRIAGAVRQASEKELERTATRPLHDDCRFRHA